MGSEGNGTEYKARLKRLEKKLDNIHMQLGAMLQITEAIYQMMAALGQMAESEQKKAGILLPEGMVPDFKLDD